MSCWRGGWWDTVSISPDLTFYTTSSGYYRITLFSTVWITASLSLNWISFTWNYNWKSHRINLNCCNHDTINHLQNNFNTFCHIHNCFVGIKILFRGKLRFQFWGWVCSALFLILSQLKQQPSKRCIVHQSYMAIQPRQAQMINSSICKG